MVEYFTHNAIKIFQEGLLDSYMEEVLDRGLLRESLAVEYFDASSFKTTEVDFEEDLKLARNMFDEFD